MRNFRSDLVDLNQLNIRYGYGPPPVHISTATVECQAESFYVSGAHPPFVVDAVSFADPDTVLVSLGPVQRNHRMEWATDLPIGTRFRLRVTDAEGNVRMSPLRWFKAASRFQHGCAASQPLFTPPQADSTLDALWLLAIGVVFLLVFRKLPPVTRPTFHNSPHAVEHGAELPRYEHAGNGEYVEMKEFR
ncbi:hypothetical protein JCM10207_002447 [Rhodosporidiobolus poonsookiae]